MIGDVYTADGFYQRHIRVAAASFRSVYVYSIRQLSTDDRARVTSLVMGELLKVSNTLWDLGLPRDHEQRLSPRAADVIIVIARGIKHVALEIGRAGYQHQDK